MQAQQQPFELKELSSRDHFDLLHPCPAYGVAVFWEQQKKTGAWKTFRPDSPDLPQFLANQQDQEDRYLTVNEFYRWRVTGQLKSLRACYVDIDGCTDLDKVINFVTEANLPQPSAMIYSGRGMHLYWLIEPVPAKALPVWQMVQNKLVETLMPIGADPSVKDCTRVLRLCGTINSKNGAEVTGKILTGKRWTLHQLSDAVLGERPKWVPFDKSKPKPRSAKVHNLDAAREHRKKYGSIYEWWKLVHQDLITIGDWYLPGGIPEGHRDKWLFLATLSLSWFVPAARVESEMIRMAQRYTPGLTMKEVQSKMRPIMDRANASMRGEKIIFNGQEVDPRYQFRRVTLYYWMQEIIPNDLLLFDLRAIIPEEVRTLRRKEREKARPRRHRDRMKDSRHEDHYTFDGVRVCNREKREKARELRATGMTLRAIATELAVGETTVWSWLKTPATAPAFDGPPHGLEGGACDSVAGEGGDRVESVQVEVEVVVESARASEKLDTGKSVTVGQCWLDRLLSGFQVLSGIQLPSSVRRALRAVLCDRRGGVLKIGSG
jgi:hypothetical protein